MYFNVLDIPHEKTEEDGVPVYTFKDSDLYPAMIERIKKVLFEGDNPSEILAPTDRGGVARADRLLRSARDLPEGAWDDALKSRDKFTEIPYQALVGKNTLMQTSVLESFAIETQREVLRMVHRGYALEIALGWFSHALRLSVGKNINRINPEEKPSPFRL